jgi:acyl carrier protein
LATSGSDHAGKLAGVAEPASVPAWDALEGVLSGAQGEVERVREPGRDEFVAPSLRSRHVYLKPITPGDYPLLQILETVGDAAPRWRHRGVTPSPDQWAQTLWAGVLVQFMVVGAQTNKPIGRVVIYQPNFQDRHAYFAAMRFDPADRSPLMVLGISVFLEYVFGHWEFEKLYMEVPEYNLDQFASGLGRLLEIEARLRGHLKLGGRSWDQLVLALYRGSAEHAGLLRTDGETEPESTEADVSWEQFVAELAAIAQVCETEIQPDSRVLEDLALDSLALAELGVVLVDKYGTWSSSNHLEARRWDNVTVRELYDDYLGGGH